MLTNERESDDLWEIRDFRQFLQERSVGDFARPWLWGLGSGGGADPRAVDLVAELGGTQCCDFSIPLRMLTEFQAFSQDCKRSFRLEPCPTGSGRAGELHSYQRPVEPLHGGARRGRGQGSSQGSLAISSLWIFSHVWGYFHKLCLKINISTIAAAEKKPSTKWLAWGERAFYVGVAFRSKAAGHVGSRTMMQILWSRLRSAFECFGRALWHYRAFRDCFFCTHSRCWAGEQIPLVMFAHHSWDRSGVPTRACGERSAGMFVSACAFELCPIGIHQHRTPIDTPREAFR